MEHEKVDPRVERVCKMNAREVMLKKYEVIEKIMNSEKIDKTDKAYYIEMFLKSWFSEEELEWLWAK